MDSEGFVLNKQIHRMLHKKLDRIVKTQERKPKMKRKHRIKRKNLNRVHGNKVKIQEAMLNDKDALAEEL